MFIYIYIYIYIIVIARKDQAKMSIVVPQLSDLSLSCRNISVISREFSGNKANHRKKPKVAPAPPVEQWLPNINLHAARGAQCFIPKEYVFEAGVWGDLVDPVNGYQHVMCDGDNPGVQAEFLNYSLQKEGSTVRKYIQRAGEVLDQNLQEKFGADIIMVSNGRQEIVEIMERDPDYFLSMDVMLSRKFKVSHIYAWMSEEGEVIDRDAVIKAVTENDMIFENYMHLEDGDESLCVIFKADDLDNTKYYARIADTSQVENCINFHNTTSDEDSQINEESRHQIKERIVALDEGEITEIEMYVPIDIIYYETLGVGYGFRHPAFIPLSSDSYQLSSSPSLYSMKTTAETPPCSGALNNPPPDMRRDVVAVRLKPKTRIGDAEKLSKKIKVAIKYDNLNKNKLPPQIRMTLTPKFCEGLALPASEPASPPNTILITPTGTKLGAGGYSQVWEYEYKKMPGWKFALKITPSDAGRELYVLDEVAKRVNSDPDCGEVIAGSQIIEDSFVFSVSDPMKPLKFFMSLMNKYETTLRGVIKHRIRHSVLHIPNSTLTVDTKFIWDIVRATECMQQSLFKRGIVMSDFKPENIMAQCVGTDIFRLVVIDIGGLAVFTDPNGNPYRYFPYIETFPFMTDQTHKPTPEQMLNWSFIVLLLDILFGESKIVGFHMLTDETIRKIHTARIKFVQFGAIHKLYYTVMRPRIVEIAENTNCDPDLSQHLRDVVRFMDTTPIIAHITQVGGPDTYFDIERKRLGLDAPSIDHDRIEKYGAVTKSLLEFVDQKQSELIRMVSGISEKMNKIDFVY